MLEPLQDVLSRLQRTDGTEFELRFTVPRRHFHALRKLFAIERESTYSESTVCFADCNDIRCVDSVWQRKRLVRYQSLPCVVPCRACISVESPCDGPPPGIQYVNTLRQRWSFAFDKWRVDWTKSECRTNVEIEYTPPIDTICDSHSMQALDEPLQAVLCQLSYLSRVRLATQQTIPSLCDYVPFVPHVEKGFPVSRALCKQYTQWMSAAQPTSLLSASTDLSEHLVSIKYDGVRMVMTVLKFDHEQPVACGLCRRGRLWHLPCTSAPRAMVLDCEVMSNARHIVVFDVFAYDGQHCQGTYAERLAVLESLPLPRLHGFTVTRKTFFPPSAVSDAWYARNADGGDGLIYHDRTQRLGIRSLLYKWKPVHTVDLAYHRDRGFVAREGRRFLPSAGVCDTRVKPGDIWECRIDNDHIIPMSRRRDKLTANALHVCHDIWNAHRAQLSLEQLADMARPPVGTKRKAESINNN